MKRVITVSFSLYFIFGCLAFTASGICDCYLILHIHESSPDMSEILQRDDFPPFLEYHRFLFLTMSCLIDSLSVFSRALQEAKLVSLYFQDVFKVTRITQHIRPR